MDSRSPSPPLPTFGIRNLSGPSPGLITITKRQYESTIKSQPDARLLYLDDDDGELITVGSGLELSQRLEEPVLKYTRGTFVETRNPVDDKLVHVFDIKRSSGSLAEWRDHEAYSSKGFRRQSVSSDSGSVSFPTLQPATFKDASKIVPAFPTPKITVEEQSRSSTQEEQGMKIETSKEEATNEEAVDILGGVEKHLNGLANVLQIAADTMQRAADKTRETDSTVVEDILRGVRDILVEVGTFGVEVYKEMNRPIVEDPFAEPETESSAVSVQLEDARSSTCEVLSVASREVVCQESGLNTPDASSASGRSTNDNRVKFASVEAEIEDASSVASIAGSDSTRPVTIDDSDEDDISEYSDANPSIVESQIFKPVEQTLTASFKTSILDDSSEDADFTARYPPLHTVRRAHSTIERPSSNMRESPTSTQSGGVCDHPARRRKLWEDSSCSASRQATFDACRKPLPGAWPDSKNDSSPALPVSSESSGAFFNRMTGRTSDNEDTNPFGLQRANTTASSNPASRLSGPFDPGFPYEPSKTSSHLGSRLHRRPYFQFRDLSDQLSSRSHQSPAAKALARLEAKRSVPNFAHSARRGPISLVNERPKNSSDESGPSFSKFDSHRAVKHHRSVPHFQPYASAPPAPVPRECSRRMASARSNWVSQLSMPPPDYLTGSNMPSAPLTTFPVVVPQPYTPNKPQQAPPAIPLRPFVPSPILGPSVSSVSSNTLFRSNVQTSRPDIASADEESTRKRVVVERSHSDLSSSSSPSAVSAISLPEAESSKNKFDICVEKLQMCGFGIDDDNLRDRLHVYAVAANGDVEEAVEMIEEDRRVSDRFE